MIEARDVWFDESKLGLHVCFNSDDSLSTEMDTAAGVAAPIDSSIENTDVTPQSTDEDQAGPSVRGRTSVVEHDRPTSDRPTRQYKLPEKFNDYHTYIIEGCSELLAFMNAIIDLEAGYEIVEPATVSEALEGPQIEYWQKAMI